MIQLIAMFVVVFAASSASVPDITGIHESPTSVIQGHFQGLKDNNIDLIMESIAPASRAKFLAQKPKDLPGQVDKMARKQWGIPMSEVDIRKITIKTLQDGSDKKHVDVIYKGLSGGDAATVIKIDGKWYIERF